MGAKTVSAEAMLQVREYARSKSHEVTLRIGGALVVSVPIGSIVLLCKIIGVALRGFPNLPREVRFLLIGGALFAVIHPGTRRTIATALSFARFDLRTSSKSFVGYLRRTVDGTRRGSVGSQSHQRTWQGSKIMFAPVQHFYRKLALEIASHGRCRRRT